MSNKDWVDYKHIKATVGMSDALEHYGVKLRKVNATYLRGNCPLPSHTSDTKNCFGVATDKNMWSCQSKSCADGREGKRGGNVLDFVAAMEHCTVRDAAVKLRDWFCAGDEQIQNRNAAASPPKENQDKLIAKKDDTDDGQQNPVLGFELKNLQHAHPYLENRGVTPQLAAYFGIGFFSGKGTMANRIVIPIHNAAGELVAYAGRAIEHETQPRYKLPNGFHKSRELFNLHRVIPAKHPRCVVVVEGFFDAIRLHQTGINAVALMGCSVSSAQRQLLADHFEKVVLMLDGDKAGRDAAPVAASYLSSHVFVKIVNLPDDTQPDSLPFDVLHALVDGAGDSSKKG